MWFLLSLTAVVFWGGSDLFSKIGSKPEDKYSHWKIVVAVGLVMGLHATVTLLLGESFSPADFIRYLPATACYIASMVLGYVGLRYIMLSVSSPICNSSGAVACILCLAFLKQTPDKLSTAGIILVLIGVTALAFAEKGKTDKFPDKKEEKYRASFIAVAFPIFYCILDGLGTFADALLLDSGKISESSANIAYEYTFFFMAVLSYIYIRVIKKQKFNIKKEAPKFAGALCETAGQFAYIYALGANAVVAAPMISSYCVFSVLLSRVFLKEKLSLKHYGIICIVLAGIVLMGISEGLSA